MVKAIETIYRGWRFRSRLEARWAVYFDAIGIEWEYEREGYEFEDGLRYLPDFWLKQVKMWAEVKPEALTPEEILKARWLVKETGYPLLLLFGLPECRSYWAIHHFDDYPPDPNANYFLTMYKDLPVKEGRFWASYSELPADFEINGMFEDIADGVFSARSARFEFEEDLRGL